MTLPDTITEIVLVEPDEDTRFIENNIRRTQSSLAELRSLRQYYREGLRDVSAQIKRQQRTIAYWQSKLRRKA